jgi:hypothetical protein
MCLLLSVAERAFAFAHTTTVLRKHKRTNTKQKIKVNFNDERRHLGRLFDSNIPASSLCGERLESLRRLFRIKNSKSKQTNKQTKHNGKWKRKFGPLFALLAPAAPPRIASAAF